MNRKFLTVASMMTLLFVLAGTMSAQIQNPFYRDTQSQMTNAQMRIRERIQRERGGYNARVILNNDGRMEPESWGLIRIEGTGFLDRGRYNEAFSYSALYNVRSGNIQDLNYQFYDDPEDPGAFTRDPGAFTRRLPPGPRGTVFRPTGTVRYSGSLVNVNSNKCLDVPAYGEAFDGTFVQQRSCAGQSNQAFDLINVGRDDYAIFNRQTQNILEIPGQRISEDGAELQLSQWTGEPNQLFRLVQAGAGNFRLINEASG